MNSSDFRPTASIDALRLRAATLRKIRSFFDEHGFIEVQTPVLSTETVVDAHLDPVVVSGSQLHSSSHADWYLQTSPELLMKRLLTCGIEAIYQIGPVFRGAEFGQFHNPEFTMVEWYRVSDTIEEGVRLLAELTTMLLPQKQSIQITAYAQLLEANLGFNPLDIDGDALRAYCELHTDAAPFGMDRDTSLEWLFTQLVQPKLVGQPTIVTHYPASQSALAQLSNTYPGTAERFELFIDAVELANGYGELLDAEVLRQRIVVQNRLRRQRGASELPVPEKLLAAMNAGLPPCSGCALGLDRLLMVISRASDIRDVLTFPADRV